MRDPAHATSATLTDFEGYGFAAEVDGVFVDCCLCDDALARWQSSLECSERAFRRMRRYGSHILAAHLRRRGAKPGEHWIARITSGSIELHPAR